MVILLTVIVILLFLTLLQPNSTRIECHVKMLPTTFFLSLKLVLSTLLNSVKEIIRQIIYEFTVRPDQSTYLDIFLHLFVYVFKVINVSLSGSNNQNLWYVLLFIHLVSSIIPLLLIFIVLIRKVLKVDEAIKADFNKIKGLLGFKKSKEETKKD